MRPSLLSSHSSPASSSHCWKYDVFLSFRGEDTRKIFVDHLYSALVDRLIHTYKDVETLPRGDVILPSLLKAIENSQIAVIIFSKNYADSSWCLDELAYIMKCRFERGKIVMPIFYDVNPSEVREQKGEFGKGFAKQELKNTTKAESWRKALVDASNIAGWEPKQIANGHESIGIRKIIDTILDKLYSLSSDVDENLVGMGTRMQYLKSQLEIGSGGVRMVGIWGVGGGGKTTLATSVYMEVSHQFEGHCIVDNIREESSKYGLKILQEKVLSTVLKTRVIVQSVEEGKHKIKSRLCRSNVLIVLDDVDDLSQLEALAGSHNWFGVGSRIIITTRDEHLLKTHRVDEVSPVSLLSHDEAFRLFKRHAYQENNPVKDYEELSLRVISYAARLPLALKVLGSFLYDKDKSEWMSVLSKLRDIPNLKIIDKLKISYDGLDPDEKELFLDIACFFRREAKNKAMEILEACGFNPGIGMKVLIQKALITISDGMIDMHDLVQDMGQYIVRGEHPNNPEKHSRVWKNTEIFNMFFRDATMDYDNIEAITYDGESKRFPKLISNMKKLRLLYVTGNPYYCFDNEVVEGSSFLSNELRYIYWSCYPASPFPESFQPIKLVVLKLDFSSQKELWKGYKYIPCLRELCLGNAQDLVRTPDFGGMPCLQKLTLKHCWNLKEIHPSFGNHRNLVYVSLHRCDNLRMIPTIMRMERLEILEISKCIALLEFPEIQANMDSLVDLSLKEVGIEVLPSSIGEYCTNLISLKLENCRNLKIIEGSFDSLKHLQKFDSSYYTQLGTQPNDLYDKKFCLEELRLPRMRQPLFLCGCPLEDGEISYNVGDFSNLQELDCGSYLSQLDFRISQLTRLKHLNLTGCSKLVELPELPSSIVSLIADECKSLEAVLDIHTNCKWLSEVSLNNVRSVIGGNRILQSMLQGNSIENHSMILQLKGLEIPKGFIPPLLNGTRYTLELPENWHNDFCGFLMCAAVGENYNTGLYVTIKHEKDGSVSMDSQARVWKETYDKNAATWVGYISFGSLIHTSWWDSTYKTVSFSIKFSYSIPYEDRYYLDTGFGVRLVPRKSESWPMETTTDFPEFSDEGNYCTHKFKIDHDSTSALKIVF